MNNLKRSIFLALAYFACLSTGNAAALGDQWYFGLGAGVSWLQPNPRMSGVDIDNRLGTGGNLFVGVDIDDRASGQLTLYGLGEAELNDNANDAVVAFQAFDGSVLYRFYDSKDRRLRPGGMHLALYGRFALGFLNRDTSERLENDSAVYFGGGAGAEWFISNAFSIRLEGMYLDKDATHGSLQLVGRFGGRARAPSLVRPAPRSDDATISPQSPVEPDSPNAPAVPSAVPDTTVPESSDAIESAKQSESAEQQDAAESDELTELADSVELIEPTETNEPGDAAELAETTEPQEAVEQINPVEAVELIEPVEAVEPVEVTDEVEPQAIAKQAEQAELIEPIEPTVPSVPDSSTELPDADRDGDNVPDAQDQCLASRPGYPVRSTGCALFDGVLSGVSFVENSSALLPDATDQLDFLANVLIQYPQAKIEVHAHTDNIGSVSDQTALTRARVRAVGAYLVRQGVKSDRLLLRSFGGSRPLYDNESDQGRLGNNRVEVIESRN